MSYKFKLNANKYLTQLKRVLCYNGIILAPKDVETFAEIAVNKQGEVMGWDIYKKVVSIISTDKLTCTENVVIEGDRYSFDEYSFHFQPSENNNHLNWYRIDLEKGTEVEHINTDPAVTFHDHIKTNEATLDFKNFNCLLAIMLSLQYIQKNIYPTSNEAITYNSALEKIRRRYTL